MQKVEGLICGVMVLCRSQLLSILFWTSLLVAPAMLESRGSQILRRDVHVDGATTTARSPGDPRVEITTTGNSGATPSRVAKNFGVSTSRTIQHSDTRKRAYRRARRRAETHGGTVYRGRWMTAAALGTQQLATSSAVGARREPSFNEAPRMGRARPRICVRSYNVGGVTSSVYDVIHHWLTTSCTDDIVILQELHWGCGKADSSWQIPGWSVVTSADARQRFSGIGIFVSSRVAKPDQISHRSHIPGRLLHVRCTSDLVTLDVIAGYQWVRSEGGSRCTADQRSRFWAQLGNLLNSIPSRNLVVVGADFNTQCRSVNGLVGRGVLCTQHNPDPEFEALLAAQQLVLLNTWGRADSTVSRTYQFGTVNSQIDFIAMRRPTVDRIARQCKSVEFDLAPWRGGGKHRAIVASIPWRAGWLFHPQVLKPSRVSLPALRQSLHVWDRNAQELQLRVRHTLTNARSDTTLQQLNKQMLHICAQLYPGQAIRRQKPCTQPMVVRSVHLMWQAHRTFLEHRHSRNLRGIISAWKAYRVLQRRSRELRAASRLARRQWFENHILTAEAAAQRQDIGAVYRVIRILAPKRRYDTVKIRKADGTLLGPREEFDEILAYFRDAFDGDATAFECTCEPVQLSQEEIVNAIGFLKCGKAIPKHSTPAELWRLCPSEYAEQLLRVLSAPRAEKRPLPPEITDCELTLLPKPHKPGKRPSDLRPLGLQDPSSKVVAVAVRERLNAIVGPYVAQRPQFAYIKGKSIDGAIARVLSHCSSIRAKLQHSCLTVHDRREGRTVSRCLGGAMLSLDLSRAFDEVPRPALDASLAHAGVPADLRELIMQLHTQCHYAVTHKGQQGHFPMRKGVRQGCALSPLLFTVYTCHLYDVLASRTSASWAAQAITMFADDTHISWDIDSTADLRFLVKCIQITFQTFEEFGMRLNPDKSKFILKIRGGAARKWIKAHTQRTATGPVLNLGTPHEPILIPRVHCAVYLGIVISYGSYEQQTFAHRHQAALQCRHRLSKVLRSKRLLLKQRTRLYVACIRSSLLYGLHVVGITPGIARKLDQFEARSLRAIAFSPSYITRESTASLRLRLGVMSPLQAIQGILDRRLVKCQTPEELAWFRSRLFDVVTLQQQHWQHDLETPAHAEPSAGVPCSVCGQYFLNAHIMRSHKARTHGRYNRPARPGVLSASAYTAHAVDGMPTCAKCGRTFTRVEGLKKHVRRGCEAKPVADSSTAREAVGDPVVQVATDREELLGHSCRAPLTASRSSLALPSNSALLADANFCEMSRQHWKLPLENESMRAKLAAYCVICGQWCARVKQHHRLMHVAEWALHDQAVSRCCSAGLRAASSCQHCGLQVSQPSRHLKHCTVLYQASLASLILAQVSQHGHREGGGGSSPSGSRGDAAGNGGHSPAEPEHYTGTERRRPGGRPGPYTGGSTAQMAEASFQAGQRKLTGWLVPRRLGPEAPVGATGQDWPRATDGTGPGHPGCDAEHGESGPPARGGDPEDQNGCRLHGLHRYFRAGHPSPAPLHGRKLVPEVCPGHGHDSVETRPLPLHVGDPEDEGRGGDARRGAPSALHERGVDSAGNHGAQPGLGVSHLGLRGQMPDQGGNPSSATLRGPEDDRPANPALPEGRCPQELQDPSQDVAEGSVQGGGSSIHGLHRASGRVVQDLLRCPSRPERPGHHEADRCSHPPGARTGVAADQTVEGVLHGDLLLRLGSSRHSLEEQRGLGRPAVAAHEVVQHKPAGASLMLPLCKLQNRTNLCYCNAVCTALYWLGEVSTLALACYGTLEAGLRVMRANKPIALPDCLALRPLFVHWRHLHQQHDAGEFLQHLLSVARPRACDWRWESRLANPHQLHDSGDCGAPLLLNLSGGTLQGSIDEWHNQYAVHALAEHHGCVFLQLCRYVTHTHKNMQQLPVRPGDLVAIPVFTADTDLCTRLEPFRVIVVVYHLGATVTSGHYKTLIGHPHNPDWTLYTCDDNKVPKRASKRDFHEVDHNAYLVGLLRCP